MLSSSRPLLSRALSANEVASDSPGVDRFVRVLEPNGLMDNGTLEHVVELFAQSRQSIVQQLNEHGALLLRNFPLASPSDAESLLDALGVKFDDEYLGGASPRSRLSDHFFSSTEAPGSYVITFHTEMCYLQERPGKILFYCMQPPTAYGETPVFDCAAAYRLLPPDLANKISELGVQYQRFFMPRKSRFLNVYKTWMDAFNATTREEVEVACAHQGMTPRWHSNGSLTTTAQMPGVIQHPVTGDTCLSLTLYNAYAVEADLDTFPARKSRLSRFVLTRVMQQQFSRKNVFMRTLWGDGSELSKRETQQIIGAAWQSSTLFKWQQKDLLIIDNIRCGHGRLNVKKPRKIAAALGDPYSLN